MTAVSIRHKIEDPSYDLITHDGSTLQLRAISDTVLEAIVEFHDISPWFVGFEIGKEHIFFNGKSVLAQIGINVVGKEYELILAKRYARARVHVEAIGPIAKEFIRYITPQTQLGKLFAKDDRRRVTNPDYITRMFGRSDRFAKPLLSLGACPSSGRDSLILDTVDNRVVAYLPLLRGRVCYDPSIFGFLPTLAQALQAGHSLRQLLQLHQIWSEGACKNSNEGELLLVKTSPLHVRTVFAHVVNDLLASGYTHTTASILQPDTKASGDIYELFGHVRREITDIPLEFYTLEPYRDHVFFADRDQLQSSLQNYEIVEKAFQTAPQPTDVHASVFIVKGQQLLQLAPHDWITQPLLTKSFFESCHNMCQATLMNKYIEQQSSYSFLKAIETGNITSQGVLFSRYLPPPSMKRMLLSEAVSRCLKGIYFQTPSQSTTDFFSIEDRALLNDVNKFGIPIYWVDFRTKKILQYAQKANRETGMFVAAESVETYISSTVFGVYGSNIVKGPFEEELHTLLQGIITMRSYVNHPLLNTHTPISLITGGGPGAMELANRVAKELNILSCANIADFRVRDGSIVNEQIQNSYIEAKMTYRLKELVERQSEFNLDFPIFVQGGIGTDFEFCLEEVRRKVGCIYPTPVLLFGSIEYWMNKISSRYRCNIESGTITGSEWISGCFFCVQTAQEGLVVYKHFFEGTLQVGQQAIPQELGFVKNIADVAITV